MKKNARGKNELRELTRIHELVYEVRVKEVMTPGVITVSPDTTMKEMMKILRVNRISGVPVVDGGDLVGIISLEDLVNAMLDRRHPEEIVSDRMTREVVALRADELAVQAVNLFAQYGYGRLPIVDGDGKLVGILTGSDITRGLLKVLSHRYHVEEIRRYRASHFFDDIESEQTSIILGYHITAGDFDQGGAATSKLKRTLELLGANPDLLRRVTISSYEAEMNLILHTTTGGELRAVISPERIIIITEDEGPGIDDPEAVFKAGFTTAADWVRELGFGAGMGLTNIKRYSDHVSIEALPGRGSRLLAIFKMIPPDKTKDGE
ncbi:MAG: CBS domain-containing protein [Deltaproteobacteria bacterium]|nr:CBS domain-containing protein [Deltaproteobacteria bacterium]